MPRQILAVLLFALSCGCGQGEAQIDLPQAPESTAATPLAVSSLRLVREQVSVAVEATGTTAPVRASNISPAVAGRVERIAVEEGDHVTRGQTLIRLDGRVHALVANQARQAAAAAELQAEQVAADYARLAPLAEGGSLPSSRAAALARAQAAAQAQAAAARAAASAARSVVGDTTVRAPFEGDVATVFVELGEMASVMPPTVLLRLVDLSHVEVKAQVGEADFARLSVGDQVHAHLPSLDLDVEGQVSRLGLELNPMTRSGEVVVRFPNAERRLRGGLFTELRAEPSRTREAVLLPREAVSSGEGSATVYVIEDGVAHAREIQVRRFDDYRVELVSGLELGQVVAAGSLTELTDGRVVTTQGAGAGAIEARP